MKVTLKDIEAARKGLKSLIEPTPLLYNPWISESLGVNVYLKLENMQPIGSFKIRGATHRISRLTADERKRGVIAASAGNHAQGVAWGCRKLGVSALIVMPANASLIKVQNTKALGAEIVLIGDTYEEAYQEALRLSKETGRVFVHAFENADVIAGQGTIALEVLDQLPETDVVIASIGGGGLLAGISTAMKAKKPGVEIIGCQAEGSQAMLQSLKRGRAVHGERPHTFADGIAVARVSEPVMKILKKNVDRFYAIDDATIAGSMLTLLEKAKIVTEGSAAIALSTLEKMVDQSPKKLRGKNVVLIMCGGNMDVNLLSRVVEQGLIKNGRRLRVNVRIEDRPGSLARLTDLLGKAGANILQAIHDRGELKIDQAEVELLLETRGPAHARTILKALREQTLRVKVAHA